MALARGARFGPYEIADSIGAGGMGEVYRAVDLELKRDVAIKVLPPSFVTDGDRLARFQREAEVLAALNHPNVAHIYGLQKTDGMQALVMELVAGETLAARLARGAIPVDEALAIALQIASALEAAHERSIVHRDLKPANVTLRPDGTVKVLDFGIAKLLAPLAGGATTASGTTPAAMTETGFVLGTTGYMSPEQARGHAVDERTDIWAFGCVLYEMLAGRAAFLGDDGAVTLARVLEGRVDFGSLPAGLEPAVRQTLGLCLQKDPKKRIADIRDVRLALDGAFATEPDRRAVVAAHGSVRLARAAWLAAGIAAGGMLATAAAWRLADAPLPPAPEMRLELTTPATPTPLQLALSPDGRNLAFVASADGPQRLWLRGLAAEEPRPIPGTEGARYPFWSPDGRSLGFFRSGNLLRVSVAGGAPEKLATVAFGGGASFDSRGGLLFAFGASHPLWYVAAPGGTPTAVTQLGEGQAGHRFPHFLPDGRRFLFYVAGREQSSGLYLGSLDGGEPSRLTAADSAGAFLAPNWVLYAQQGALLARRLDPARAELTGEPVIVATKIGTEATGLGGFSVSAAGHVALRSSGVQPSHLRWRDRLGAALDVAAPADTIGVSFPELSPDGRRVVVQRAVAGNWDLWWLDTARGSWSPLTRESVNEQLPVWSPDSASIAHSSNRSGSNDLYVRDARGGEREELIVESPNPKQPQSWSPDGRWLLYYELDPTAGRDLWLLDLDSRERKVFVASPFEERAAQISPDGRWVAYETDASGQFEVVVQSFPEPAMTWPISTRGGTQPRWSPDGSELYFVSPELMMMAATVGTAPNDDRSLEVGAPTGLFPVRPAGDSLAEIVKAQYAVARDGRFLLHENAEESAVVPITLILNWAEAREPGPLN
jgi:Tol biopolymer transport system component